MQILIALALISFTLAAASFFLLETISIITISIITIIYWLYSREHPDYSDPDWWKHQ